ncbi:hypothetical protein MKEN_00377500 [Mycena kentingensis (nom. inval.)]|nr:hypothetical protein MKEN_00377500 [Mycena kentingensis (nom. inval.)]
MTSTTREHMYRLYSKGEAWATLLIAGDATRGSNPEVPAFVEGAPVSGEVSLNLASSDAIHTVVVSLRAQIITGSLPSEKFTFYEDTRTLWSSSPTTKKLKGRHTWPFSLSIPSTVSLAGEEFRSPQSFFERHTRGQIDYELCVRFMRPKLRSDHRLSTVIEYFPVSKPSPPSGLRQLAYAQNTTLLGPDSDPEGWKILPTVTMRGRFDSQTVGVSCMLSLATPLCYTRGTSIPCALQIECSNPAALNLLAAPDSIVLRLRRNVRFLSREVWNDEFQLSEMATWWWAGGSAGLGSLEESTETLISDAHVRRTLKGEIHLRAGLVTSSTIAHYRLEYAVVLLPFDAPGYESLDSEPLIVEPVEIASDLADGPCPLTYSTP